jgi:hypothetical protein
MRELEQEIEDRLQALADDAPPPPDLSARILHRVSVRRRRRRAAEATAVTLAVVASIGRPAYVSARPHHEHPAAAATPLAPSIDTMTPTATLSEQPNSVTMVADPGDIPRRLPGGWILSAYGVGSDGGVLGVGVKYASDGTEQEDGRLWQFGKGAAAPATIASPAGLWTAASGDGVIVWPEHRDAQHDFQLLCRSGAAAAQQVGDRGVAADTGGFHVDRDVIVWTDEGRRTVWMTKGCAGSPRAIDTAGYAVAFSYPHAYIVDATAPGEIRQLDVVTGATVRRTLPSTVTRDGTVQYAAGPQTLSYSDGHGLVVIDTKTWRPRTVSTRLPHSKGLNGEQTTLTAGDGAIVYSTRPLDGAPDTDKSVVYRTDHPKVSTLKGEAYTKGKWLIWRDHNVYRLQDLSND